MSEEGQISGMSGADEPEWGSLTQDGTLLWQRVPSRPDKFYPDGSPILDDELMPAFMKWALLFETVDRVVGNTRTLYGERLSTVWLGLDHSFGFGPPLIFETMLFAPDMRDERDRLRRSIRGELSAEEEAELERDKAYIEKNYPHHQLQLRYSTRRQAEDRHEQLKLHCLIPPRWRSFLLGTIGGHNIWKRDEEEDAWN